MFSVKQAFVKIKDNTNVYYFSLGNLAIFSNLTNAFLCLKIRYVYDKSVSLSTANYTYSTYNYTSRGHAYSNCLVSHSLKIYRRFRIFRQENMCLHVSFLSLHAHVFYKAHNTRYRIAVFLVVFGTFRHVVFFLLIL